MVYLFRLKRINSFFRNEFKGKQHPIIISGSPRGGTTWLYEVLQASTNSFGLWEPLHPKTIQEYYPNTNQWFHKYIPPSEDVVTINKFIADVCQGDFITESMLQKNIHFKDYKSTEQLLVKFCRLNALLPWFVNHFKNYKVIQIYRNPLAVVASQMKHGAWNYKEKYNGFELTGHEYYPEYYEQYKNILSEVRYPEEQLAVIWALDVIPAFAAQSERVLHLKYEELFLYPEENFNKIFNFLNIKAPGHLNELIQKPSSTTKQGSNILTEPKLQLETWKKNLTEEQANRVKNILLKFGFMQIDDVDYSLEIQRS